MSLDDEIRVYERALLRSGQDPRQVAARLLGANPDRYWLVVDGETPFTGQHQLEVSGWVRVDYLVQLLDQAYPRWRRGWAKNVITIKDAEYGVQPFTARGHKFTLWDSERRSTAFSFGSGFMNPSNLEQGWNRAPGREPGDGERAELEVKTGGQDSSFEVPRLPSREPRDNPLAPR